jgi:hypothetical protein
MTFVLPVPPDVGNARGHWRGREAAKRAYWMRCAACCPPRKFPKPDKPWPRVRVQADLYLWNEMDEDNAMARLKLAVDWLVVSGYIENDRRKNIEWVGLPSQEINRKFQRLELTVEVLVQ